jgi:predicted  nucleic acid-binding Zn-ribbon protein
MVTTYRKLIDFFSLANNYLQAAEEAKEKDTPLSDALTDAIQDWKPEIDKYNKQLMKLRRKFAEKDKKTTVLLKDKHGNYQFTENGENDLDDAVEELLEEEVHIDTDYVSEIPEDLHRGYLKGFKGFVIDPNYQPKKEAK